MEQPMLVVLMTLRFRASWCRSLKDKRAAVRAVTSALKNRHNVSVAESGQQESWTLFDVTVASLAFHQAQADSLQEAILRTAQDATEAELYSQVAEVI